ncbi:MAG: acyltransferase [Erythrobacter sp.]
MDAQSQDRLNRISQTQDGKIVAIQAMRALAAGWVAFAHLAWGFADNIETGLGLSRAHPFVGEAAVALFFVVSGYVMVVSSRDLFGAPRGAITFWLRRIVRIMPAYWIATALLVLVFVVLLGRDVDLGDLALSAFLVPYWPENGVLKPVPFLWPGWTLFYEMAFYALFGLCLILPRARALWLVSAALLALAILGVVVPPANAMIFTLTRTIVVIFVVGIALAAWREKGRVAPTWLRWSAGLAAIPALLVLIHFADPLGISATYTAYCGIPASLLSFALLSGPLTWPAPRLITALGNMSYAFYLLHVPIAWSWNWFYRRLPGFDPGPWDYLVTACIVTFAVSWYFYSWIEQPMTKALNLWAGTPHGRQPRN